MFSHLKDADDAKDYQEKLVLINQRREMISYLNQKYGSASKVFLEIFKEFRTKIQDIIHKPNKLVKKLIHESYQQIRRENETTFKFRNENLGDMKQLVKEWWKELKGDSKTDEISKKDFLKFALKKRIIVDEKELESLFKDLLCDCSERQKIRGNEF